MTKKLITVLLLALIQFGCAEQYTHRDPAPVQRTRAKAPITQPSAPIETFKYPEQESIQGHSHEAEVVPNQQAPEPQPAAAPVQQFSPAVTALITEAELNSQSGKYESAGVKLERALRIEPRNATLTYKLAEIRLKQEQPRLAEDLAKKAALLAGKDRSLKKQIWLLIAESKRLQKDPEAAKQAENKAAEF